MTIFALGINHRTAELAIRERVSFAPDQAPEALQQLCELPGVEEAAILSTCNRTELYVAVDNATDDSLNLQPGANHSPEDGHSPEGGQFSEEGQSLLFNLLTWLSEYHEVELSPLQESHYWHAESAAVQHVMKVACGLDSMVLGEPQILGQLKSSYAVAQSSQTVGTELNQLFQMVFSTAKRVRTETAIGQSPVSVAYAAVSLSQQIFSDLADIHALLIGAGETIELVARHLHDKGVKHITVANRTLSRAQQLAENFNANAILLSQLHDLLPSVDMVISSTASQLPILGKGAVESALKARKHRPIFMVDIAVPRDIEPEVESLSDVYLYTVDDLQSVIQENMRSRQSAADSAEKIVEEGVQAWQNQLRAQVAADTIRAFRSSAEDVRDRELQKALVSLELGQDPEQVLRNLARSLTNKLMHTPTTKLKQAGEEGRKEHIDLAHDLFGLKQVGDKTK